MFPSAEILASLNIAPKSPVTGLLSVIPNFKYLLYESADKGDLRFPNWTLNPDFFIAWAIISGLSNTVPLDIAKAPFAKKFLIWVGIDKIVLLYWDTAFGSNIKFLYAHENVSPKTPPFSPFIKSWILEVLVNPSAIVSVVHLFCNSLTIPLLLKSLFIYLLSGTIFTFVPKAACASNSLSWKKPLFPKGVSAVTFDFAIKSAFKIFSYISFFLAITDNLFIPS